MIGFTMRVDTVDGGGDTTGGEAILQLETELVDAPVVDCRLEGQDTNLMVDFKELDEAMDALRGQYREWEINQPQDEAAE